MSLLLDWRGTPARPHIERLNEQQDGGTPGTTFAMGVVLMLADQRVMGREAYARVMAAHTAVGDVLPFDMPAERFALLCRAYEGMSANVNDLPRSKWAKRYELTARNPLFDRFLAIYDATSVDTAVAAMAAATKEDDPGFLRALDGAR